MMNMKKFMLAVVLLSALFAPQASAKGFAHTPRGFVEKITGMSVITPRDLLSEKSVAKLKTRTSTSEAYSVGYVREMITDTTRVANPETVIGATGLQIGYDPNCGGTCRRFAVDIFYPIDYQKQPFDTNNFWNIPASVWRKHNITVGIENAPVANGKFPLILWSNGYGGGNVEYLDLLTAWVKRGFIVASVQYHPTDSYPLDFTDRESLFNTFTSREQREVYSSRTVDMKLMLDLIEECNTGKPLHVLHNHVNMNQIAASGHSVGGWVAYALNAGQVFSNGATTAVADPRIKAIIPLDGSAWIMEYAQLQNLDVPMLQFGSFDSRGFIGIDRAYAATQTPYKYNVYLRGNSVHGSFSSNICKLPAVLADAGLDTSVGYWDSSILCGEPSEQIQLEDVVDVIVSLSVPFLRRHLSNSRLMDLFLNERYVQGIENERFYYVRQRTDGESVWSVQKALEMTAPYNSEFVAWINNENNTLPYNLLAPAFNFYQTQPSL